jgi:hypothetical protein
MNIQNNEPHGIDIYDKYMFWHYEHFWPINKCNFIEINLMSH